MTEAIDALPEGPREVLVEVLGERDPELLSALRSDREPTMEERERVEEFLADALTVSFEPNYEPTVRGRLIEHAIDAFLERWPIETRD